MFISCGRTAKDLSGVPLMRAPPQVPPTNTIILGLGFSIGIWVEGTNIQSIAEGVVMVIMISFRSVSRPVSSVRSHLLRENFLTTVNNYCLSLTQGWPHGCVTAAVT